MDAWFPDRKAHCVPQPHRAGGASHRESRCVIIGLAGWENAGRARRWRRWPLAGIRSWGPGWAGTRAECTRAEHCSLGWAGLGINVLSLPHCVLYNNNNNDNSDYECNTASVRACVPRPVVARRGASARVPGLEAFPHVKAPRVHVVPLRPSPIETAWIHRQMASLLGLRVAHRLSAPF